jgi:alkanesulfonate monooxygenase SsuD/methylene tetrahydromethanopterin reductase-like flavin-dependent oxidoreductase (luciferase family)
MLARMKEVWKGEEIGPKVDPPPSLIIGGQVDAAYERAARFADGWIMGGGPPDQLAQGREKAEAAWKAAGREGSPRIMGLIYYSLGDGAEEAAQSYLHDYYAWLGDVAGMIASSAATDAETVKQYVSGFEQAGCDELVCFPCSPDPEQVDLLAEAAL